MVKSLIAKFAATLGLFLFSINTFAQIGHGGTPPSFNSINTSKLKSAVNNEILPAPDVSKLQNEDRFNDSLGMPYRISQMIHVNLCMDNSGTWDILATGEKIWRLKITSANAKGLYLIYDNFYLPKGSKLFLYSDDKKFVIGSFNETNNQPSRVFATEIIPGENCTLEYVASGDPNEKPSICISNVAYVYRGMAGITPAFNQLERAGACEVNIRCSPEGDNWKDVRRSVAKVIMGNYECSGNLLNNTAQDFKNLFSIAFHCIDGLENTAATWVFYFNYEQTACSTFSTTLPTNTMTGAEIRAKIPLNQGGDGVLLELNGVIPTSYNPYWAGWDRTNNLVAGGACIEHPAGDVKKIATNRDYWLTSTWYGIDTLVGAPGAHWRLLFAATPNGHGVTEGGASGSGIFGPDERFRGSLSGGSSSCTLVNGSNLFGKLSYNWDKFGSTPDVQFKTWLDPINSGTTKINGIDHNTQHGVFWSSTPPVIEIDSTVTFTDESIFHPTSRLWTFTGGDPAMSSAPNPLVKYASSGLYDVSLQVTNDSGTFTKTRTEYVYVRPKTSWIPQHSPFTKPSRAIAGFSIVDSLVVWAWAFNGFDAGHQITEYTQTLDGGVNWKADSIVNDTLKGFGIGNLFALSKDTAFASIFGPSGGGHIVKTADGGKTWQLLNSNAFSKPNGFPNFVYFFDRKNGVCAGDPNGGYFEVYTTSDGGDSWTRVSSSSIPANQRGETGTTNVYDAVKDTMWFGTTTGRIYRSANKGLSWSVFNTGLGAVTDVKFRNSKVGFAVENDNSYIIKKSVNGGTSWSTYTQPSNLLQGEFAYVPKSPATWVDVSVGSIYSTDDGLSFSGIDNDVEYTAVKFYNQFIGWAGGFNVDSIHRGMYKWDKAIPVLTSVKEENANVFDNAKEFAVFPNPTKGMINIVSQQPITNSLNITVVNIQGATLTSKIYRNIGGDFNETIDISQLAQGFYFVIIQSGENFETHKVVLVK
jgi:PKD repeat protein